jgi:murein DD-endopeptidase MepM/ murein hydrolase activator NlpD
MSFERASSRKATLFVALIVALSAAAPTDVASAHEIEGPPFEFHFPQETEVTEFSSGFGARRSGGRRHGGIDIMAPKLTQVYAVAPGIIRTVGESSKAGRYIEIDHMGGWTTMYVHLNNDNPGTDDAAAEWSLTVAAEVTEGAWVTGGQLIAWVGDSGNAEGTGSHTHFELAYNGSEIDPYHYLVDAYERDHLEYQLLVLAHQPLIMI